MHLQVDCNLLCLGCLAQQVVRMAREADPEGLRTIGVLTKPDTIEDSDHEAWVRVLSGDRYPLRLGYYCVRNPTPKELEDNMSLEEAAAKESSFFSSKAEFASAPFAVQQRYGVQALREALSKELVVLAQRELPKLRKSVEDKLAKVRLYDKLWYGLDSKVHRHCQFVWIPKCSTTQSAVKHCRSR